MPEEVVVVFTYRSTETIIRDGGAYWWKLNRDRARKCVYAVCTRNAFREGVQGTEEHQSAFLVGKVSGLSLYSGNEESNAGRYIIHFSEYAQVNIPNVWDGDRNPVKYSPLEEFEKHFNIDFSALQWEPMPGREASPAPAWREVSIPDVRPLTIAEAKHGLSLTFGVPQEAIEITIRG